MLVVPQFYTQRLILKAISIQDSEAYTRHFVDYEVIRHLSAAVPWPYPEAGVLEYLEKDVLPNQGNGRWDWGIFLKSNPDELIGSIGLWHPGVPENRGFWLGQKFWGQGLMTEAVEPVSRYAFFDLGFRNLMFANALGNLASRKVKEKSGARVLEIIPGAFVDKKYTKKEVWELSKAEFLKHHGEDGICRRYAESDSTVRHVWNISRIWKLAESLKTIEIPIEEIVGLDSVTWFSPDGDKPTIRNIAAHAKRIMEADTSYPPILTEDNRVFDGMHRIARHLMQGQDKIKVKKFEKNPEPDMIEYLRALS